MPVRTSAAARLSADDRRAAIVEAAVAEFAHRGLTGTSTEAIARRAGISQPYIFRLFGTKRDLFLAAAERCMDRIATTFRTAAQSAPPGEARFMPMGLAYKQLLADRELLLLMMQCWTACDDAVIREAMRRRYGQLWRLITELTSAPPERVKAFFAIGMLLNVAAAMDLPAIANREEWAAALLDTTPEFTHPTHEVS